MELRSGRHGNGVLLRLLYLGVLSCACVLFANAQDAADFFRQNCVSCHTIGGGRLTGPDLKNVSERKDREWLARFMMNPQSMISQGDPYAQQLVEEARGVVMPQIVGLTRDRADALLELIEAETKLEQSQFAGTQVSDKPFTPEEISRGRSYFLGEQRLANGGPPCISCHTAKELGGLSGGRLGPDLSRVFERLEGRKNLAAWLSAPATPTMAPIYKQHAMKQEEVLSLVAYLEDQATRGGEDMSAAGLTFLLIGLGGAGLALVAFDLAWRRRFRSVRKEMVLASTGRGEE
jgi:mono/diheme cytochrome c family protein